MKNTRKIRLALLVVASALVLAASPRPARSTQCFRCAPNGDGTASCKLSTHGMTACTDDAGNCVLSGSTC